MWSTEGRKADYLWIHEIKDGFFHLGLGAPDKEKHMGWAVKCIDGSAMRSHACN